MRGVFTSLVAALWLALPAAAEGGAERLIETPALVGQVASGDLPPVAERVPASPRMRFDIVLNNLAGLAWTIKKIAMTSDGTPWRPLVSSATRATPIPVL